MTANEKNLHFMVQTLKLFGCVSFWLEADFYGRINSPATQNTMSSKDDVQTSKRGHVHFSGHCASLAEDFNPPILIP